jgi:hypothetical protein
LPGSSVPRSVQPDRHAAGAAVARALRAFGRFWWEFFVGDTPELFVGVVAILARRHHSRAGPH